MGWEDEMNPDGWKGEPDEPELSAADKLKEMNDALDFLQGIAEDLMLAILDLRKTLGLDDEH